VWVFMIQVATTRKFVRGAVRFQATI
jgi:hypothetical protein